MHYYIIEKIEKISTMYFEVSFPHLKSLLIKTTTTYEVENLSRGLRQALTCGGVKPVNVIPTQSKG